MGLAEPRPGLPVANLFPLIASAISSRGWAVLGTVVVAAGLVPALMACQADVAVDDPALPPGFQEAWLPNVEVQAYLYVDPGRSPAVPVQTLTGSPADEKQVSVRRAVAVMGKETEWVGASFEFATQGEAQLVRDQFLAAAIAQLGVDLVDERLLVVRGSKEWSDAVRLAWRSDEKAGIQERYPEVWEVVRHLPKEPPATPVAAGFLRDFQEGAGKLLEEMGASSPGLGRCLALLRLESVAFAAYADDLQALPAELTNEALRQIDVGVIAAAHSTYPGLVFGLLLEGFAETAGLQQVQVSEEAVYYLDLNDQAHLMAKNFGSVLFIALSLSRDGAERLMEAVVLDRG